MINMSAGRIAGRDGTAVSVPAHNPFGKFRPILEKIARSSSSLNELLNQARESGEEYHKLAHVIERISAVSKGDAMNAEVMSLINNYAQNSDNRIIILPLEAVLEFLQKRSSDEIIRYLPMISADMIRFGKAGDGIPRIFEQMIEAGIDIRKMSERQRHQIIEESIASSPDHCPRTIFRTMKAKIENGHFDSISYIRENRGNFYDFRMAPSDIGNLAPLSHASLDYHIAASPIDQGQSNNLTMMNDPESMRAVPEIVIRLDNIKVAEKGTGYVYYSRDEQSKPIVLCKSNLEVGFRLPKLTPSEVKINVIAENDNGRPLVRVSTKEECTKIEPKQHPKKTRKIIQRPEKQEVYTQKEILAEKPSLRLEQVILAPGRKISNGQNETPPNIKHKIARVTSLSISNMPQSARAEYSSKATKISKKIKTPKMKAAKEGKIRSDIDKPANVREKRQKILKDKEAPEKKASLQVKERRPKLKVVHAPVAKNKKNKNKKTERKVESAKKAPKKMREAKKPIANVKSDGSKVVAKLDERKNKKTKSIVKAVRRKLEQLIKPNRAINPALMKRAA